MADFDLFFGRFQPIHNGHVAVLKRMNNPVVVIVKGKQSVKDKNPFSFRYQAKLLRMIAPDVSVYRADTGYLPDMITMIGGVPERVFAGPDRLAQYKAQVDRANKDASDPMVIQFEEAERITSASVVREALRSGDKKAFKANVPSELWGEFSTMKKRIKNV